MKRRYLIAFAAAALFGTAAHYFYHWLPIPLVGLFAPVNESVWEHLKLLFWPTILAGIGMSFCTREKQRLWSGVLSAALAMPLLLLGIYYTAACGFGIDSHTFDIVLYYVVMAAGFSLACALERSGKAERWTGILVILAGIYGASLILFTIAAPNLPIFAEPQ
jgi:uncharacterized membrane protein YagU involved in acid resistance